MPDYTYEDALASQTEDEIYLDALSDMEALEVNVAGFDPRSPNQALPRLHARALSAEQALRVLLVMAGSLRTAGAAGDTFLDALALGWFDEERIPAIAAVWDLALTTAAGGLSTTIATASRQITAQADDGVTLFQNTNSNPVLLVPGGTVLCRFTCTTKGTVGNVGSGDITSLVIKPPGVTCTNAAPGELVTAGRDAESNDAFVSRLRGKWAARLGAAWSRAALNYRIPTAAPTLTRWRIDDANPYGPGTIKIVLANATGGATADERDAVIADLESDEVKALGSGEVTYVEATLETVVIAGTVTCSAATLLLVKAALDTYAQNRPIGESTSIDHGLLLGIITGGAYPSLGLDGFEGVSATNITTPAAGVDVTGIGLDSTIEFETSGLTAV